MDVTKIGFIGCGNISNQYLKGLSALPEVTIAALADLKPEVAKAQAEEYKIEKVYTPEELLADPEIGIVLNLTIPDAHFAVSKAALEAGKHVYLEKPLSITFDEGKELVDLAAAKGLKLGCAPDTFMGRGIQTAKKVIADGKIGNPISALGFMLCGGPEPWHPNPIFYYKPGGGPLLDMGPYYLTAMIYLMGRPVKSVTATSQTTYAQRIVGSGPLKGDVIDVETPTHLSLNLEFEQGGIATLITSFDLKGGTTLPNIEIHGTESSIKVPDPNTFDGDVLLNDTSNQEPWEKVEKTKDFINNCRGVGITQMIRAIKEGTAFHASGDLALHILDIMELALESAKQGKRLDTRTRPQIPGLL